MLFGYTIKLLAVIAKLHSAVGSGSDCRGHKFESQLRHINFVEIARETIATVILPLPRVQERQLSVTSEYWLTAQGPVV